MKVEQLQMIATLAADRVKEMIMENEAEIRDNAKQSLESANELIQEGTAAKARLTLNHAIILDLLGETQTDRLSWTVKHTAEIEGAMPDPTQPELEFKE